MNRALYIFIAFSLIAFISEGKTITFSDRSVSCTIMINTFGDSIVVSGKAYNNTNEDLFFPSHYCTINCGDGISFYPRTIVIETGAVYNSFETIHTIPYLIRVKSHDSTEFSGTAKICKRSSVKDIIIGFDYLSLAKVKKSLTPKLVVPLDLYPNVYTMKMKDYMDYCNALFVRVEE